VIPEIIFVERKYSGNLRSIKEEGRLEVVLDMQIDNKILFFGYS